MKDHPTTPSAIRPERIMAMANAFHESCVLFAAAEADLFTHLARLESADAATLAAACERSAHGVHLLLDACVAVGLLEKDAKGCYRNTPESAAFLVADVSGDLRQALRYNRDVYPAWGRLSDFVRDGQPVERPEIHLGEDPERTRRFVLAMHGRAMAIGRAVVPHLDLRAAQRVMDIGGGSGAYSILLAQRFPRLHCRLLDLPAVAGIARECVAAAGLSERIACLAGDYHHDPLPPDCDAALLFGMLHQESPAAIVDLFRRVATALKPGGRVYVLDMMTDDSRCRPRFSALFALNMALTTAHGWVFSDRELRDWMQVAGLVDFTCTPLPPPMPHWLASAKRVE